MFQKFTNLQSKMDSNETSCPVPETTSFILKAHEVHALRSTHCKKDDCNICKTLETISEQQDKVLIEVPAQDCRELQEESNISLGICRICHCNQESLPELGSLESVCHCRGTVALVHMYCLERWLAESEKSNCELCGYQYKVERIPKHGMLQSMYIWANEVADPNQVLKDFTFILLLTFPISCFLQVITWKTIMELYTSSRCSRLGNFIIFSLIQFLKHSQKFRLVMDTMWFWLMTPLAAMAGYIFIKAASELMDDTFPTNSPWLMAALLVNSCITLLAYYGWVITCVKQHLCHWYKWWRTMDCLVRIQLPDKDTAAPPSPVETDVNASPVDELAN